MEKLLFFPVLLYVGCVMSGLYGVLHNQISYTVSPAFFEFDLFPRFDIPEELHNRLGAALVGWKASWWMGLLIGPPLLLIGLFLPGRRAYITRCLFAFGLVASTTLFVGLGALACANVDHVNPIHRAGMMHNFSYLGGFLGILTGATFLIVEAVRLSRRPEADQIAR